MKNFDDPADWYEWLVEQSRTDHIYDLIHNYLTPHFCPAANYDFCLLCFNDLPEILLQHISGAYYNASHREVKMIDNIKYIVISNTHLTEYLEAARQMLVVEDDEGNSYIQLIFTQPVYETEDEEDEEEYLDSKIEVHPDDVLKLCWDLIVAGKDRAQALTYALVGESFLLNRQQELAASGGSLKEVIQVSTGFNIISVAYTWNNRFDEAAKCDEQYLLKHYLWSHMEKVIGSYLEMLMIKKHTEYLDHLFSNADFRKHFYIYYETHMSIKDPSFEWTKMREIVPILNRVNNGGNYL
jgi:hypothetical protein